MYLLITSVVTSLNIPILCPILYDFPSRSDCNCLILRYVLNATGFLLLVNIYNIGSMSLSNVVVSYIRTSAEAGDCGENSANWYQTHREILRAIP